MDFKLEEKKRNLEAELKQKIQQFQNTENIRNQFAGEITEMKGKLQMIDELIVEKSQEKKSE